MSVANCALRRFLCGGAGVPVDVCAEGEDVASAKDFLGVCGDEAEDDAGAGAYFDDEGTRGRGGGAKAVREPCGFGGGGERVEEEVGVFGGFVDGVEGDVRCVWCGEHHVSIIKSISSVFETRAER